MANTPQFGGFNPSYNSARPEEFLNLSRPISDISPDKSTGTMIDAAGDFLKGGLQLGDKLIKDKIQADIYDQVDVARDNWTAKLEEVRAAQVGGAYAQAPATGQTGSNTPMNLIPEDKRALPPLLANGLEQASIIARASRDPKVTDTLYDAELLAISKNLRAQYPSYRAYIDQQMSSITGKNPANAYAQGLMQDINQSMQGATASRNSMLTFIKSKSDLPDAQQFFDGYVAGKYTDSEIMGWVNRHEAPERERKIRLEKINEKRAILDEDKIDLEDFAGNYISKIATAHFEDKQVLSGTNSASSISDFIIKAQNREISITTQDARAAGEAIYAQRAKAEMDIRAQLNKVGKNGRSIARVLGKSGVDALVQEKLALFDVVGDLIYNEKYGQAYATVNAAKALEQQASLNLYEGELGNFLLMSKTIEQASPALANKLFGELLLGEYDARFKELITDERLKGLTQPRIGQGEPATLSDSINKANRKGVRDQRVFSGFVDAVKYITDPDASTVTRTNAITYLFDPKNKDVLGKFNNDYTDDKGKLIPGRQTVFSKFTSPEVAKEIAKIAASNPKVRSNYLSWVSDSFAHQLFAKDIANFKELVPQYKEIHKNTPNYKLEFNPEHSQFELKYPDSIPYKGAMLRNVEDAVTRVNTGLRGLKNVQDAFGGTANGYVMSMLENLEITGNEAYTTPILDKIKEVVKTGVASVKAGVDNTRKTINRRQLEGETRGSAIPFAEEAVERGGLNDFIRNPAGPLSPSQNAFEGARSTPVPRVKAEGGKPRDVNLTGPGKTVEVLSVEDIPEGMDPNEFIRQQRRDTLMRDIQNRRR